MTRHYDEAALQEFLDGRRGIEDQAAFRAHLASCPLCAAREKGLRIIDGALHRLPLERPAADMTTTVMARIRREHVRTWVDLALDPRILTTAVIGAFGTVVAGTMGIMALQSPGTATPGSDVLAREMGEHIGSAIEGGTAFLTRAVPQVLGPGAIQITMALVVLVPLLVLADRFLAMRRLPG